MLRGVKACRGKSRVQSIANVGASRGGANRGLFLITLSRWSPGSREPRVVGCLFQNLVLKGVEGGVVVCCFRAVLSKANKNLRGG